MGLKITNINIVEVEPLGEEKFMRNHGDMRAALVERYRPHAAQVTGLAVAIGLLALPALGLAQDAPTSVATAYRDIPQLGGSRNIIWVIAQLHLLLAGFVLGVPIFAWLCEIVGWKTGEKRYDKLAKEFTKLLTSSYATTALFGGILLFMLIGFYPKLMAYLSDIFFPSFVVYCGLFLVETATLYLYWYGWDSMQGTKKPLHLFLGFLLNVFAFFIMIVPNSWATFQASPVVIAEGSDFARAWAATWNPTWWPVNIHRLIANVVLGGYICGAYAGIRYLSAQTPEERDHYDWMGYVGNFIGVFGLLPLPFAGYWLMREIYAHGRISFMAVHPASHADRRVVSRLKLLLLARDHAPHSGLGDQISQTDYDHAGHTSTVPRRLDDATLLSGQLGRSAEDGRDASSAVGRLRCHVGQDDCRQFDDSCYLHELHHVLASRKRRDGRMGQSGEGAHERGAGHRRYRGDCARCVGLFCARHYPH
jgi:hypothetical protein